MKKLLFIVAAALCMTGCYTFQPISTSAPRNNPTYGVSYLFEYEGVRVYRFYDAGRYVYFTKGGGNGLVTTIASDSTAMTTYTYVVE